MLDLKKVAITGLPGSGKSTALKQFKKLGCKALDCDEYVHELLNTNQNVINQVKKLFGNQILTNEHLDRTKMARLVFSDETSLQKLQKILYPEIKQWLKKEYDTTPTNSLLFVVEVPMLFEAHWENDFDVTLGIWAKESECKKRFFLGEQEFEKRKLFHLPNKEKLCDFVIENDTPSSMEKSIEQIYLHLTRNQKSQYDGTT